MSRGDYMRTPVSIKVVWTVIEHSRDTDSVCGGVTRAREHILVAPTAEGCF
ncbi:hypothetical protein Pmar_PMAR013826 [Perkinsus marinus ATCC 50983]|uniref:Uncharacterized protein n=1 Tax=Perkinsus marinus (strain ATCC 50983 / TXsc) TaxID=423536 RepID=C5L911_PERM5|nr:hypothetical protein Pmar_PMAR013826 [Perkinsus marinus ATCC 50983]EER06775.1 hypothetical protein Pmar_PMAR013826 [Perkinsus marinus ATCC 50983]|eukprot:XP_002774959.1 hypothetical protein Pmar_PMAR013826 [Perkinsus marinus ATCC 50983]